MTQYDRLRVSALQYFIRPVTDLTQFREQVEALVDTAADYRCQLVVFPEYFTVQLLTLGDIHRPIQEQLRFLADYEPQFVELMSGLAAKHRIHIVGGTLPVVDPESGVLHNECKVFGPGGMIGTQRKLHMTRFEDEEWMVSPGSGLRLFDAPFGRFAVAVCYDVEFPEIARAAALSGADLLVVPSCTDDRQGFFRVRYCAHARAIENQMYVVVSSTVGSLPMVPAVHLNYGQAAILTPSDFPFARDGLLAEGNYNQEMMVIGELNFATLRESRLNGTVLPLRDSTTTAAVLASVEVVTL
ncbi:MAG TPA: carbon-nitrogen hydrolase family protein [Gemmatimonadales bacterium]|nr:carbon-nitrogen hydrolase family protein [Gemmatimonadales bacterium]